jgi:hypothetical protein
MRTPVRIMPWLLASCLLVATAGPVAAAGQAVPRDGYPPYPGQRYPDDRYPDGRSPDRRYPDRDGRYRGGWWGYRDVGYNNGFEDGYRAGLDDARDRDRYDPVGERKYRKGDNGYNHRYGPKGQYKQQYREGFRTGYDRGYREGRYYDRDGYGRRDPYGRRGRWGGWPW